MNIDLALLQKYNVPVPRYTSYPTVPFWKDAINIELWKDNFRHQFNKNNNTEGISVYIHLPFCESLCTYCGCNKKITTNHSVEAQYIEAVLKEWQMYLLMMDEPPMIREIHLGGGTPTFFSAQNLELLINGILRKSSLHPQYEFSIEGHPNNTTFEHLQILYDLGFRRISYGVQDNDPVVQHIINRIQPFENLVRATKTARDVGFTSINFDLIYGLPKQTLESIERTVAQTISLRPDRIAFYSYAHVPWTSKGQRLFDIEDLPSAEIKMNLYTKAKSMFIKSGYFDVGMDHFALASDSLYDHKIRGRLHRNFMGYTTQPTNMLIGLGVSGISDTGNGYAQNEKKLRHYYDKINSSDFAVTKGYFLSEQDVVFKKHIIDIACKGETIFEEKDRTLLELYTFPELEKLENDGLVIWSVNGMTVTEKGKHFIRNICKSFDLHLIKTSPGSEQLQFSKAI